MNIKRAVRVSCVACGVGGGLLAMWVTSLELESSRRRMTPGDKMKSFALGFVSGPFLVAEQASHTVNSAIEYQLNQIIRRYTNT